MRQLGLAVKRKRGKKLNTYLGEFSPAEPNLVNRNFRAEKPNEKWYTDITEFSIPAGKAYLSPVIDGCDMAPVAWNIGTSPNAELANTMLKKAIATLPEGAPGSLASPGTEACPDCKGAGTGDDTCETCGGDGTIDCGTCGGNGYTGGTTCGTCNGEGTGNDTCETCDGTGRVDA